MRSRDSLLVPNSGAIPQTSRSARSKVYRKLQISILLLASMGFVVVVSETILQRQNSLHQNGRWRCTKTTLRQSVMGAVHFATTRNALTSNRLNLGVWHGNQEVIYKKPLSIRELSFNCHIPVGSYLVVTLDRNREPYTGVRLSRNDLFNSVLFRALDSGEFKCAKPLGNCRLADGWNHCRFTRIREKVVLTVNGEIVADWPIDGVRKQQVGFRGSYADVFVDDVEITSAEGVFVERFRNTHHWARTVLAIVFITTSFNALLFWLTSDRCGTASWRALRVGFRKPELQTASRHSSLSKACILNVSLLFAALFFWGADRWLVSPRYLWQEDVQHPDFETFFEDEDNVIRRIADSYSGRADKDVSRVMFIGTSQTWGAGAKSVEDVFPAIVQKLLADHYQRRFECINVAISGSDSTQLLSHYVRNWLKLDPLAVVINLSNNDSNPELFRINLSRFAELNRANGIRTLLILEPNSPEFNRPELEQLLTNHQIMRRVATTQQLEVIDMHAYFRTVRNDGFQWWDRVHMTSFGNELFARHLVDEMIKLEFLDIERTNK